MGRRFDTLLPASNKFLASVGVVLMMIASSLEECKGEAGLYEGSISSLEYVVLLSFHNVNCIQYVVRI